MLLSRNLALFKNTFTELNCYIFTNSEKASAYKTAKYKFPVATTRKYRLIYIHIYIYNIQKRLKYTHIYIVYTYTPKNRRIYIYYKYTYTPKI